MSGATPLNKTLITKKDYYLTSIWNFLPSKFHIVDRAKSKSPVYITLLGRSMGSLRGLYCQNVLSSFFPWSAYVVAHWFLTMSHVVSVGVATEFLLWICKWCKSMYVCCYNDTMWWMRTLDLNKTCAGTLNLSCSNPQICRQNWITLAYLLL